MEVLKKSNPKDRQGGCKWRAGDTYQANSLQGTKIYFNRP